MSYADIAKKMAGKPVTIEVHQTESRNSHGGDIKIMSLCKFNTTNIVSVGKPRCNIYILSGEENVTSYMDEMKYSNTNTFIFDKRDVLINGNILVDYFIGYSLLWLVDKSRIMHDGDHKFWDTNGNTYKCIDTEALIWNVNGREVQIPYNKDKHFHEYKYKKLI